jgi:dephospho-CoA kinase
MKTKKIVGLTGPIGSGKDTVANYLKGKGYKLITFSDLIGNELDSLGVPRTRENLQEIGEDYRKRYGEDYWAKKIGEMIEKGKGKKFVVNGIRNLKELEYFRNKFKTFVLIAIVADEKIRYERKIKTSKKIGERHISFEEFKKAERRPSESDINKLVEMADFKVDNNGTIDELYQQIDEILDKLT